jgi:small subunit ribosomal protein S8
VPEETTTRKNHIMTMTDPIADMLTRLRNANQAYHDVVSMPYSKMKAGLAEILKQEGYINGYKVEGDNAKDKTITVELKYGPEKQKVISGLKRISKPGLRVYAKGNEIPRVLNGLGIAIISTSKGLMTDRDARKANLGGEVVAYVW